jgi:hypothetical protein
MEEWFPVSPTTNSYERANPEPPLFSPVHDLDQANQESLTTPAPVDTQGPSLALPP